MRVQNTDLASGNTRTSIRNSAENQYKYIHYQQSADIVDLSVKPMVNEKSKFLKPFGVSFKGTPVSILPRISDMHIPGLFNPRFEYENIIRMFPADKQYYEQVAAGVSKVVGKVVEPFKLASIVGKQQLTSILHEASPEDFNLGEGLSGVKNLSHRINMHNHTLHSDGQMQVARFLDQASSYADKVFAKTGKPYIVAITDHDILDGVQEAATIIAQDPYKFRNLKLVLGTELSVSHINPEDVKAPLNFEMIGYGLNPFNEKFNAFLRKLREGRQITVQQFISKINEEYKGLNLNWTEAQQFSPNLGKGTSNGHLWLARDYAVFKSYLKLYADRINSLVMTDPAKKLDIDKLMIPTSTDYRLRKNQGLVNGVEDYFRTFGIEGYNSYKSTELKQIFASGLDPQQIKSIEKLRDDFLRPNGAMINPNVTVTHEQVFDAYRQSGDAGMFGVAHPGFIQANMYSDKIAKYCEGRSDREPNHHLIWVFFNRLVQSGQELFKCSEANYQSYGNDTSRLPWIQYMRETAQKLGLLRAGGVDCHTQSLFTKHIPLQEQEVQTLIN